jgi:hypothetical protein
MKKTAGPVKAPGRKVVEIAPDRGWAVRNGVTIGAVYCGMMSCHCQIDFIFLSLPPRGGPTSLRRMYGKRRHNQFDPVSALRRAALSRRMPGRRSHVARGTIFPPKGLPG